MATLLVIFGATGDLTNRKLLPALYQLARKDKLSDVYILGVSRRDKSHDDFRRDAEKAVSDHTDLDEKAFGKLASHLFYHRKDFDKNESYERLAQGIRDLEKKHGIEQRIFYLATLPRHFRPITTNLKKQGLAENSRVVIEKPFGHDLASATELNDQLTTCFDEDQIYRIDHYIAKETVQNILALRFANKIFEAVWNRENIDQVQITVTESVDAENRGKFYDRYGAVKDMVQNHLLQVLSLVAMEPPEKFEPESIAKKKVEVLRSMKPMDDIAAQTLFGQYEGYTQHEGVSGDSRTETYAAIKLCVGNERWDLVPFFLRTGKNLKRKASEIVVHFKKGNRIFGDVMSNVLVIRLQPDEGIYLRFNAKKPGTKFALQRVSMDFCHECIFGINTPEAYERLLHDVMEGNRMLFTQWEFVREAWKIIDPIARYWSTSKERPYHYKPGTWGPKKADRILTKGRKWREPM